MLCTDTVGEAGVPQAQVPSTTQPHQRCAHIGARPSFDLIALKVDAPERPHNTDIKRWPRRSRMGRYSDDPGAWASDVRLGHRHALGHACVVNTDADRLRCMGAHYRLAQSPSPRYAV